MEPDFVSNSNQIHDSLLKFDTYVPENIKPKIIDLLPICETVLTSFESLHNDGFSCMLRMDIRTKEHALAWLKEFQEISCTTYNTDKTYAENSQKTVFKKIYHCLHNTKPAAGTKSPHEKHTNCQAKITINVKNPDMKRSKDAYLKKFPCLVSIRYDHNHTIHTADAYRHKKPQTDIEEKFKDLFSKGHSPSSALKVHKIDLQCEHDESYLQISADGSKCPTRNWCYYLYRKIFQKEYGHPTGLEMVESLQDFIKKYNEECVGNCASMFHDGDDLVIALCSPFMKRVHKYMKESAEIMFIDSSGNMDRHNSRVFQLLCPTLAGGLPIGMIITYSEAEENIFKGLELLKGLLDENAFYGKKAPNIIITDDSQAERNALRRCFPSSRLLLCKFHVLQSMMRYLWDNKHGIHRDDKVYIYRCFQNLVNFEAEDEFLQNIEVFLNSDVLKKYPNFQKYLCNFIERKSEWAMCYRSDLITRGNCTNNYCEAAFRVLKDDVLHRTKAFSIVQMFDFLSRSLGQYYERKITDIVNNRKDSYFKTKYFIKKEKIKDLRCQKIDEDIYEVTSEKNVYVVNTKTELCSCFIGKQGAPCKHQFAVVSNYNISSHQFIPNRDPAMKQLLYKVLTGKEVASGWFDSLIKQSSPSTSELLVCHEVQSTVRSMEVEETEATVSLAEVSSSMAMQENAKLQEIFQSLSKKLLDKPQLYLEPIKTFNSLYNGLKTDSSLISALHTFGKHSGGGMPIIKKKKNLQGSTKINVQSTASARRKRALGGRNVAFTGRPAKDYLDHGYQRRKRVSASELPPRRKHRAAPHSLSFCVDNNITLGK